MEHKNMDKDQREKAQESFNKSEIYEIDLLTEEPFIRVEDGTKFYIDVID